MLHFVESWWGRLAQSSNDCERLLLSLWQIACLIILLSA
jgi:hypothetical protein